jgi:hypothetical protein
MKESDVSFGWIPKKGTLNGIDVLVAVGGY